MRLWRCLFQISCCKEKLSNLADVVGATMLPVARNVLGEDADTLLEAFLIGVRSW